MNCLSTLRYSPLHNVKEHPSSKYPALLLVTAENDDRVVPIHSFKLISEVQHGIGTCENQVCSLFLWHKVVYELVILNFTEKD